MDVVSSSSTNLPPDDRRRAARVSVGVSAKLLTPGRAPWQGTVADISVTGTLFQTASGAEVSTGMYGVFAIDEPAARVEAVVRVARLALPPADSDPSLVGVGLEFVLPSPSTTAAVQRLMAVGP